MARRLYDYVEDIGHGAQCYTSPVLIRGVTGYGFPLLVKRRILQRFIDRQLNAVRGCPLEYTALPFVIMAWVRVERAGPVKPEIGWMPDHEAMFFVPLIERGGRKPRLTFWIPYLFIDIAEGMTTAREIHGFRKMFASEVIVPPRSGSVAGFSCTTTLFRRFDASLRGSEEVLIETHGRQLLQHGPSVWTGGETMFRDILARLGGKAAGGLEEPVLRALFGKPEFPMVCLKQIRDAERMNKACYQAMVHAPGVLDAFHGGGPLIGDFETTIQTCANYPIVHDLGLAKEGESSTTLRHPFGFWIQMDFTLPVGKVLWEA